MVPRRRRLFVFFRHVRGVARVRADRFLLRLPRRLLARRLHADVPGGMLMTTRARPVVGYTAGIPEKPFHRDENIRDRALGILYRVVGVYERDYAIEPVLSDGSTNRAKRRAIERELAEKHFARDPWWKPGMMPAT
jgi:hypothetical protein